MDEKAILHSPESKFCYALDANTICLRLRISKSDKPIQINVVYGGKYTFALNQNKKEMQRDYEDRLYAYYTATLKISDSRFVYVFEITDEEKEYYFSEDGLTEKYDFELSYYNCFQYAYINECDLIKPVEWMFTATFYQIFIDRFCIGNLNKNMDYITLKWGDIPNPKSFAGGDIKGITQKLSYLQGLGINALYLTPVFRSISNHKYDISDYYEIDEQFGTKEDLKELIDTAHLMGMKVVLDAVFNHCSENLSQFQDVLKKGRNSKYYSWFIIKNDEPLEYEMFGACAYMPKFNTSNPEVCSYLIDIATYWIKHFDIDGWRLDVSDEISHDFWRQFRKEVKSVKEDCVLIGENWHDANIYLRGDQFDSIMNYAFTKACLDFYAFEEFDAQDIAHKLNEILMRNSDVTNQMMLNLLDTHDTHRFLTRVMMDESKLMSALALTYFFPGAPCIYYGTENAMEGGYDPDCRRTFDWSLEKKNTLLKALIQKLTSLKHNVEFANAKTKITSLEGVLLVKRGKYKLLINETKEDKNLSVLKVYLSNRFEAGVLQKGGFIILEQ
ncbi:MAG: glycoside hydrolase family 13 protein [Anaeroplasmataceae bacterium]|nr:glycoside hydrolase family 13 protein [Anaeroplasmataceae bacterium]